MRDSASWQTSGFLVQALSKMVPLSSFKASTPSLAQLTHSSLVSGIESLEEGSEKEEEK